MHWVWSAAKSGFIDFNFVTYFSDSTAFHSGQLLMQLLQQFFVTTPKGMVAVLMSELKQLGAVELREQPAGVEFKGGLETAYRACLWSRTAGRVLMPLGRFAADSAEALYEAVQQIDWQQHLSGRSTLAVDFTGRSDAIHHSQFGALKVKDAIVDQLRETTGGRPNIVSG